jgi:hypothetical protein
VYVAIVKCFCSNYLIVDKGSGKTTMGAAFSIPMKTRLQYRTMENELCLETQVMNLLVRPTPEYSVGL